MFVCISFTTGETMSVIAISQPAIVFIVGSTSSDLAADPRDIEARLYGPEGRCAFPECRRKGDPGLNRECGGRRHAPQWERASGSARCRGGACFSRATRRLCFSMDGREVASMPPAAGLRSADLTGSNRSGVPSRVVGRRRQEVAMAAWGAAGETLREGRSEQSTDRAGSIVSRPHTCCRGWWFDMTGGLPPATFPRSIFPKFRFWTGSARWPKTCGTSESGGSTQSRNCAVYLR